MLAALLLLQHKVSSALFLQSLGVILLLAGTQDFSVVRDSRPPVSTTDKELHEFLESIPAHLDNAMETLNAPSASAVIVQGGQVLQKVRATVLMYIYIYAFSLSMFMSTSPPSASRPHLPVSPSPTEAQLGSANKCRRKMTPHTRLLPSQKPSPPP